MAQCPTCKTKIDEDFGLVTCPGCGAICFVDLDDNVTLQNDDLQNFDLSTLEESTASDYLAANEDLDPLTSDLNLQDEEVTANGFDTDDALLRDSINTLGEEDSLDTTLDATDDSDPLAYGNGSDLPAYGLDDSSDGPSEDPLDTSIQDPLDYDAVNDPLDSTGYLSADQELETDLDSSLDSSGYEEENFEEDLEDPSLLEAVETTEDLLDEVAEPSNPEGLMAEQAHQNLDSLSDQVDDPESVEPMSLDDFLSEIETFGSLASEPFQQSAFFFDIIVSAIDSKEIRMEIVETLSNSKLGIEEDEIAKKIRNGELRLHQIPAVKAAVIIQSLSHLNCELDWELKEAQDLGYDDASVDEGAYQEESLQSGQDEHDLVEEDSFDDLIDEYTEEEPEF